MATWHLKLWQAIYNNKLNKFTPCKLLPSFFKMSDHLLFTSVCLCAYCILHMSAHCFLLPQVCMFLCFNLTNKEVLAGSDPHHTSSTLLTVITLFSSDTAISVMPLWFNLSCHRLFTAIKDTCIMYEYSHLMDPN